MTDGGGVGLFLPPEKRCLSAASSFFQGRNNPTHPVPPPKTTRLGPEPKPTTRNQNERTTRHPQQSHRLPALDLRIPGLAPVLLWQTDHRHHLVLHVRAVLHRLDHRRSEEHTSELQSRPHLVCRLL